MKHIGIHYILVEKNEFYLLFTVKQSIGDRINVDKLIAQNEKELKGDLI